MPRPGTFVVPYPGFGSSVLSALHEKSPRDPSPSLRVCACTSDWSPSSSARSCASVSPFCVRATSSAACTLSMSLREPLEVEAAILACSSYSRHTRAKSNDPVSWQDTYPFRNTTNLDFQRSISRVVALREDTPRLIVVSAREVSNQVSASRKRGWRHSEVVLVDVRGGTPGEVIQFSSSTSRTTTLVPKFLDPEVFYSSAVALLFKSQVTSLIWRLWRWRRPASHYYDFLSFHHRSRL